MLGAIVGDVAGSAYEHRPVRERDFPLFTPASRFTDDTVLTAAVAEAIVRARTDHDSVAASTAREPDYHAAVIEFARTWPRAGFGGRFREWMHSNRPRPYQSWGNGSAMRVSPIGYAYDDARTVLIEAERSAAITHDHPEGIRAAQAVALGVLLARERAGKEEIRDALARRFGYDLDRTVEKIRPHYRFEVAAQLSVPEAIIAFLDSHDFESAIRNAIWLGGDADTQACIAGTLAEAHYGGVPAHLAAEARARLPEKILQVVNAFQRVSGR